jgi:hypothetical protein
MELLMCKAHKENVDINVRERERMYVLKHRGVMEVLDEWRIYCDFN